MAKTSDKMDLAIRMVMEDNETVLFADEYLIIKKFINRKRIVVLSERHLFYFSRKEGNMKRFNIHKLNSITCDSKQIVFDFKYPKQLKMVVSKESEDSQEKFLKALMLSIQHVSSDFEIEKIKINVDPSMSSKFIFQNMLYGISSFYGSFCRLELALEESFFQPNQIDEIKFRFLLLFHKKLVDFSSFLEKDKALKFLLEILPICPSSKYISIFQFDDKNIYQFLSNYANFLSRVENISIDGTVVSNDGNSFFNNFINQIKMNLNSKMVGLSFSNSQFTNDNLNTLQDFIISKNIQALEFHNAFSNKTVLSYFNSNFLPSISQCNEFVSLFLENIQSFDFNELYKNLPPLLKSLSIVNCDATIAQIFETIKTNSNSITVLNLSHNPIGMYQNFFRDDLKFHIPDTLTVLILDYVTFPYGSLLPFLRSLFTEINNNSDISIANMIASGADFKKLDEMFHLLGDDILIKKTELKLIRSLKWDFNPISSYFISFLKLQTNLTSLSVSGCYSPNDKLGFNDFCNFISKNDSLEKLICRKYDQISLESLTPQLLSAVLSSKINYLDIYGSKGGTECYQSLKSFIEKVGNDKGEQNNQFDLRCLIYDGLEPPKKDDLIDFIQFIKDHGCSSRCSFPISDIEYLYTQHKLNFYDVSEIISLCQLETKSDYIRPFKVFFKENQFCFPFYFRDECEFIRNYQKQSTEGQEDEEEGHSFDEVNKEFFFGSFFDELNRKSYSKHTHCLFSFYTDDENVIKNQRKSSIPKTVKSPNSKTCYNLNAYAQADYHDDINFISPPSNVDVDEKPLPESPPKVETPNKIVAVKQTLKIKINSNMKSPSVTKTTASPKLQTNKSNDDDNDDEDYSYDYSLNDEIKEIPVENKKIDSKPIPKSQISPMKPNLLHNKARMPISPKKTINSPKKIVSPTLIKDSDDSDYSYSYSEND